MTHWKADHIPNQKGKIVIVTGGNSGLGYEAVLALARKNAHVIIASRNAEKANEAREKLVKQVPNASLEVMSLDLTDLKSVHAFAETFQDAHGQLDILLNNAGVMIPPYSKTTDGFEIQFGTNHLGHFALTGLLLETLLATPHSRVVAVSSSAYRFGKINFEDLQGERNYSRWAAYGQSKLANILFTRELARRLTAIGSTTISAAAHPGYAITNLQHPSKIEGGGWLENAVSAVGSRLFAQSASMGALPELYAATAPDVLSGEFFGPSRIVSGYPKREGLLDSALDATVGARLWAVSEDLTGVRYEALTEQVKA